MNRNPLFWKTNLHARGWLVPWVIPVLLGLMTAMMSTVPGLAVETTDPEATPNRAGEETVADPAFDGEPMPRDPFWPVGYTPPPPDRDEPETEAPPPPEPEAPAVEPDWPAAAQRLRFQGRFSSRGRDVASVNNQIVEVGSLIGVRLPPYIYFWRVTAIHPDGIETERVRTEFVE